MDNGKSKGVADVWERIETWAGVLAAPVQTPGLWPAMAAVAVASLVLASRTTRRPARQVITIAHEGGHALAAVATLRKVERVHVRPDGSGTTYTRGRGTLISFAGYPFPALVGAGLLVAVANGHARLAATAVAVALALLLLRMRNLHGWAVVALATVGTGAAVWWLSGAWLGPVVVGLGWLLLAGSVRPLLEERRARRSGRRTSDVSALAQRGVLPAGAYWTAMVLCVLGSGAWALSAWSEAVVLPW